MPASARCGERLLFWRGLAVFGIGKRPEAVASGRDNLLVSDVGQQGDLTGTLDGGGQVTLVSGAGTGGTAGQNLAALGQVTAERGRIRCSLAMEIPSL